MFRRLFVTALMSGTMMFALAASAGVADLTALKQKLGSRFPNMQIVDVRPSPIPAMYEVYTGKAIYYSDKTGDYLLRGELIDTRTQDEITSARVDERNKIDFKSLPFDRAIKIVKGNGARKLALFTDPDCPYCRRFEDELKSVSDTTIYVFLFPLKIHPNAEKRARDIWCSEDRASAWTGYLLDKKVPLDAPDICKDDPIQELAGLATKLNVTGTPTMYFSTGERVSGGMKAQELQKRLADASGH